MSETLDVRTALAAAILADAPLAGRLAGEKVYAQRATPDAPRPYVVLATATETEDGLFMGGARDGTQTLDVWTDGPGDEEALAIYKDLHRVLDHVRLTLAGGAVSMLLGRLTLVAVLADPGGATHLVARYRTLTTR